MPLHSVQLRLAPGQVWCLPVVQADGSLRFAPWRSGDALRPNRFGIPEPDVAPSSALAARDLTLVLLPLLGFDARGNRLGMGGGFYDRTFGFRRDGRSGPPHLVGVAFACQEVAAITPEPWDVALDGALTEHGWRAFGG